MSSDEEQNIEDPPSPLEQLPQELFLYICSYLDVGFAVGVLGRVCKQFNAILNDERVWKARLRKRIPSIKYPQIVESDDSFSWCRACLGAERELNRWTKLKQNNQLGPHYLLTGGHFGSIDSVHLMGEKGNLCLSGSRDRALCVWDLDRLQPHQQHGVTVDDTEVTKQALVHSKEHAHKGWIWSIASVESEIIYSGGWDGYINNWQLRPDGLETLASTKTSQGTPVLSIVAEPGLVMASRYDHKVSLIDPRDFSNEIDTLKHHTGPVLGLAVPDNPSPYVFTCAEDKFIHCIDRRTWTPVSSRRLPRYALSMCYSENQLWISTGGGYLSLINPYCPTLSSVVSKRIVDRNNVRVPHVKHSLGSVACVTSDSYMRVFTPGQRLRSIYCSNFLMAEPARLDYKNGNLVCALSDGSLALWKH